MSPKALSASVSDIGSVVSMVDRVAGSAPGNGSRAAVGEDLVAMTKCRLQSRNSVTPDGNTGARKMRRYASAVYWAFGDLLLNHSNALSLLPRTGFRDTAVILMLIHQFITFGFACTPLYFVWEKFIGMHECKSMCKRALARLPVVIPIWFLAIIFPFFGPINSTVGSLLVSFTVYIIPALAHMIIFASPSARENAVERPPSFLGGWAGSYCVNIFVVACSY